ncbi:MAG: N-acetylglucosamine-6-phosphate deacetylase, partial [Acetobacteraceae bacterium]
CYRFAGMVIVRGADGAVRLAGTETLAGSALRLAQAVRNLIEWGIASAAEAERMAADNPAALLAPAVAAHGGRWPPADAG